jgi:C-terminal processing protease CtpA/Prc
MEKVGVTPDVPVETQPDEIAQGVDRQLDKAVEVLLADVAIWKKAPRGLAKAPEAKPATTPASATAAGR